MTWFKIRRRKAQGFTTVGWFSWSNPTWRKNYSLSYSHLGYGLNRRSGRWGT